jgi:hypothetical protein
MNKLHKFHKFNKFNKLVFSKRTHSTLHQYTFVETIEKSNQLYIDVPITQDDVDNLMIIETGGYDILKQWLVTDESP